MFYCDTCQKKNNWPTSITRSQGKCESCGEVGSCHDVHHSCLPRKGPIKVTKSRRAKPAFPRCPTLDQVQRAYEIVALDYVYGMHDSPIKTADEFKDRVLEYLEQVRDDDVVLKVPDFERIVDQLREIFLRVGGTSKELKELGRW